MVCDSRGGDGQGWALEAAGSRGGAGAGQCAGGWIWGRCWGAGEEEDIERAAGVRLGAEWSVSGGRDWWIRLVLFYAQTELGAGAVPFAAGVGSPLLLEQQ